MNNVKYVNRTTEVTLMIIQWFKKLLAPKVTTVMIESAGNVTVTLPPAQPGLRFVIRKVSEGEVVVKTSSEQVFTL